MKAFGETVKQARERKGVRSYDLAFRLGQSPSWVSKIESGAITYPPEPAVLEGIARELDLSQAEMLGSMGYQVEEDAPDYDAETDRIARAVAKLTPDQRRRLLAFIDSVTAVMDALDPPDPEE